MRKIAVVLTAVIGSALIAGCQADFPSQDTDGYVKEIVNDVDPDAFVIVSDVREVLGEGFMEYSSQDF